MTGDGKSTIRSGFVALVGASNAGKSTFVNQLVGAKISIVTHKMQTTRTLVRGIVIHNNTQIVLVDTPGIFQPRKRFDRALVSTAWGGVRDADIVLVIVDVQAGLSGEVAAIFSGLKRMHHPRILVLNKIDRVNKQLLLELTAAIINEKAPFERVFMVSALNGSGCGDVLDYLAKALSEGPWYYPEDQISDMSVHQLAAEITREKLYLRLHDELPYSSIIETERWEERKDGSVCIEQVVYVERKSQKKIVLGHKGSTIKFIGQVARKEISEILKRPVHLFLFVKVCDNWSDDPERYRKMGLDFSD
ncbi:MAG: GTP-binding protein Era [Candidatus Tokpelaia sp. JSC189]|nr:MAG: GTP-binding protein Era [Candidatus Tokpelaia sp. JSC189]